MKIIRRTELIEGRWRNGRGRSWDIASNTSLLQAGNFGWRLTLAEIAESGPFSHYENVDRIFTLVEGDSVTLDFEAGRQLLVERNFVPHHFACDVPVQCTLQGKSAMALNLFYDRGTWQARVNITSAGELLHGHEEQVLVFVLQGSMQCNRLEMQQGDTAVFDSGDSVSVEPNTGLAYIARLWQRH